MPHASIFFDLAPGCYLRRNSSGEVSLHTGAGVTVESRIRMVRKLIVDSLKYFQEEYHVNGYRFDLMGFLDNQTMKEIRQALGDDAILYGEAWEFTDLPPSQATTKSNLPPGIGLGAFNDSSRDAYAGKGHGKGFVQGEFSYGPWAKAGIIGAIRNYPRDYDGDGIVDLLMSTNSYDLFANQPVNTLNFLTIHDGFTLWDKINLAVKGSEKYRVRTAKMALAMLFTSQGRAIIHGGSEMGRSKPLAPNDPNKHRAHTSQMVNPENGVRYFHENTYSSPDITNMIRWGRKKKFQELYQYVRGLIKLRKSIKAFRYQSVDSIKKGLRFFAEKLPDENNPGTIPPFEDFSKLDKLTIVFKHGVPNSRYYIAGEIHNNEDNNTNPPINKWYIDFDNEGKGQVTFYREDIAKFKLNAWSDRDNLQIKLVKTAGKWDTNPDYYSPMGNNTIRAVDINTEKMVEVNLKVMDYVTGTPLDFTHNPYIAYALDNTLENSQSIYRRMLVLINSEKFERSFKYHFLNNCNVLVDGRKAGITPITDSKVKIVHAYDHDIVTVPSKTVAVLGCR